MMRCIGATRAVVAGSTLREAAVATTSDMKGVVPDEKFTAPCVIVLQPLMMPFRFLMRSL